MVPVGRAHRATRASRIERRRRAPVPPPRRVGGDRLGLDDAHLGARRRRQRRERHLLERDRLGRGAARHGHPPEQHAGRGGPQPARLPPPRARHPGDEHDGADDRAARRRDRAGARQRRLQPPALGDPAGDPVRRRRRARRRGRRSSAAACTTRRACCTPRGASTRQALARAGAPRLPAGAVEEAEPLLRRRPGRSSGIWRLAT